MANYDFTKYPKANELLEERNLKDRIDEINWLLLSKEDAAVSLAKLYLLSLMSQSTNVFMKRKAKEAIDIAFIEIGDQLHVYAKEEGRCQLGITNQQVNELFKHLSFTGTSNEQNQLI